ncbi:MAG: alpha/beta hydrolase [Geothrix sp.]|uniref:alpha/beta fold hydrolase n=1 Tax=Geothrix sp. TaxID=1962974 RepID=UPI0017A3CC9D|nr:alpha/beta hydrolase [Geothrix sp.]NWJ41976.1 alpha/beta hydrolase [Geothrix sp.]WIL20051.1 MAG: alpha/beta hydrolase [Geothrix sp.]
MPAAPPLLLVLLPGMDGTGLMFEPFVKALAGFEARVVRYPATMTAYPDCVAFARQQLPTDQPFLLLGESFSGPVAIALAAEAPEGLVGLVLCSSFARNPRPEWLWLRPLLRLLPPLQLPLPLLRRLLLGRGAAGELVRLTTAMLPHFPTAAMKGRTLAVAAVDHTALLDRIPVPMLALCASHDRLVPKRAAAWIQAHRSQLDITTLQGPHWLLQTRPEACLRAIQAFVDLLPSREATTGNPDQS